MVAFSLEYLLAPIITQYHLALETECTTAHLRYLLRLVAMCVVTEFTYYNDLLIFAQ